MAELKDSGNRREFETGAVRDMQEGKGRMDLIPWGVCSDLYDEMRKMFNDEYIGFILDKDHHGYWKDAPMSIAYSKILAEMDPMDFQLNPSYIERSSKPDVRLEKIKSCFLRMAAIFCFHHWNLMAILDSVDSVDSVDENYLNEAADEIVGTAFGYAMLEVGKHYEDGARKYSENNWRKGIDVKIYFDSASRHLMKCMSGWSDEPHDRAFLWNCLCGAWQCDAELLKIRYEEYNTGCARPVEGATQSVNDNSIKECAKIAPRGLKMRNRGVLEWLM